MSGLLRNVSRSSANHKSEFKIRIMLLSRYSLIVGGTQIFLRPPVSFEVMKFIPEVFVRLSKGRAR